MSPIPIFIGISHYLSPFVSDFIVASEGFRAIRFKKELKKTLPKEC